MFNTIRKKLIAGFSIILAVILTSTIYNLYAYNNIKTHIGNTREKAIASYKYASEMKNNIIQVEQFLTDVGATKNTAYLEKAEEYLDIYKKNSKEFVSLNPEYKSELEVINSEFERLYRYGVQMTDMYIESGHAEGNKMMTEFNKMADGIHIKIDTIQNKSEISMEDDLIYIQTHISMNQNIGIALAMIVIFLAFTIAITLASGITKPINNLLEIFKDLEKGQGDLTRRINIRSRDELAKMAHLFNGFMSNMEHIVLNIKKNSSIVSQGSIFLSEGCIDTTESINMINIHMGRVAGDTESINSLISQISKNISEIAKASHDSAIDAQQISFAVDNINKLAMEGGKLALDTKFEMKKTEEISSDTIRITEELGDKAGEIGKIIDTIKSIADQTNLLALNAAIEAASAGEHGRGFCIVAEEIRKLAENNNQSAKIIEDIVKNIQDIIQNTMMATANVGGNIRQSSKMIENVHIQLQQIIKGVSNINDRVQSIAMGTQEQSASTEELSSTMEAINDSNATITASMQEVAARVSIQTDTMKNLSITASELNESAEQLNELVSKFKLQENQ